MSLDEKQIQKKLDDLSMEWSVVGTVLEKDIKTKNFKESLTLAKKIAKIAEKMNHHPKLTVEWGQLCVEITTHEVNALTDKDFKFAKAVDKI